MPSLVHDYLKERFAQASQLAIRANWRVWKTWCEAQEPRRLVFPATAPDLRAFIASCSPPVEVDSRGAAAVRLDALLGPNLKAATTLTRYLNSIGVVHRLGGVGSDQGPAGGLGSADVHSRADGECAKGAAGARVDPQDLRRAVGADAVESTDEGVATGGPLHHGASQRTDYPARRVRCLDELGRGRRDDPPLQSGPRRSRRGTILSIPAVAAVRQSLVAARIDAGAISYRTPTAQKSGRKPLSAHEVARIYKLAFRRHAETLPVEQQHALISELGRFGGHSIRIGAAQELVANGADISAVMHAGGWRDSSMPALYVRRLHGLRGGTAELYRAPREGDQPWRSNRHDARRATGYQVICLRADRFRAPTR